MGIDVGGAISNGYERVVAKTGLQITGLLIVLNLLTSVLSVSLAVEFVEDRFATAGMGGPASSAMPPEALTGIPLAAVGVGFLLVAIVQAIVTIGAIRTFVADSRTHLDSRLFTRKLVWVLVNLFVGGILFGIVVGIGFLLLVIPGIFLLVSLYFWAIHVVVEDESFVAGFKASWRLTSGHRFSLFALGLVVIIIGAVLGVISGLFSFAGWTVGTVVDAIVNGAVTAFSLAVAADAYNQLLDADGEDETEAA